MRSSAKKNVDRSPLHAVEVRPWRWSDTHDRATLSIRMGITLFELTIAVAAFAVLLATSTQMVMLLSRQSRADEQRHVAIQSVQAVLEEVENIPWEQLTADTAKQVPLPEVAASRLQGAKLNLAVTDEPSLSSKRVVAELDWNGPNGERTRPIRLVAWVFPDTPASAVQTPQ